jgi:hypothetical protein
MFSTGGERPDAPIELGRGGWFFLAVIVLGIIYLISS